MRLPRAVPPGDAVAPLAALLRVGFGGLLLARPALLARLLGVDASTARRTEWLGRMVAGRELALGVGTLAGRPRPWLVGQMVSDGLDAVALVAAARDRQVNRLLAAAVTAFAGAGIAAEAFGIARAREATTGLAELRRLLRG